MALGMLAALLPLIIVLMLAVAARSGVPLFGHARVGQGGRAFACYKIRSMVPDAETRLADILAADPMAAAEWELTRKLREDPRVTPIGRFLRRTSLDELPQLWNVLRGDMSLVGPRPITADELQNYGLDVDEAYLKTKPGLTGVWQVQGRNDVSYDERVALDLRYARSISFEKDLRILLSTASVVLRRTGI